MMHYIEHASPLGPLVLGASERGLCGVYFAAHKHFNGIQDWRRAPDHATLRETARQLDDYFARRRTHFDLPLDMDCGTEFQRSVWQELTAIPFGHSASYAALAQRIGKPRAVRAVGAANGDTLNEAAESSAALQSLQKAFALISAGSGPYLWKYGDEVYKILTPAEKAAAKAAEEAAKPKPPVRLTARQIVKKMTADDPRKPEVKKPRRRRK